MRKGELFSVQSVPCQDVVRQLDELRCDAEKGNLVGIAYVAIYRGGEFEVHATGEARRQTTLAQGMVYSLLDYLKFLSRGGTGSF